MCVCLRVCVCISSLLSLVYRSVSKPEALQRVSERILNCDCERVRALVPAIVPRSRGHISANLYSRGSNKAQDVVATYNQSNVRTISTDRLPIVHRGRDGFTAL